MATSDDDDDENMDGVMVTLRLRPLREKNAHLKIEWEYSQAQKCIVEKTGMGKKKYDFDNVFMGTNQQCYDMAAAKIVRKALHGYNGTVFAYGQTGSGKTHSMMGSPWPLSPETEIGILPLALDEIFDHIERDKDHIYLLRCSYMEIYSESINDLLHVDKDHNPAPSGDMKIVADDPIKGAVIGGLHECIVRSTQEACDCLTQGEENRHVAGTTMNDRSSRSHCIFRIVIEKKMTPEAAAREKARTAAFDNDLDEGGDGMTQIGGNGGEDDGEGEVHVSYLNMVDLAGSERQAHTGATGSLLKEGAAINKSLSALAEVISKLSEMFLKKEAEHAVAKGRGGGQRAQRMQRVADHIPYRNSKLTRILKQSLGGNTFTSVLLCMSPAPIYHETSVSTLKFGVLCKTIKNRAQTNVVKDSKTLLREYRMKIAKLSTELEQTRSGVKSGAGDASSGGGGKSVEAVEEAEQKWQTERERATGLEKKIEMMKNMFLQGGGKASDEASAKGGAGAFRLRHASSFHKEGEQGNRGIGRHKAHRQRMASVFVTNDNNRSFSFRNKAPVWDKEANKAMWAASREKRLEKFEDETKGLKTALDDAKHHIESMRGELSVKCDEAEEASNKIAHLEEQLHDYEHVKAELQKARADAAEAAESHSEHRAAFHAQHEAFEAQIRGHEQSFGDQRTEIERLSGELARARAATKRGAALFDTQNNELAALEKDLEIAKEASAVLQKKLDVSNRNVQVMQAKMVAKDGRRLSVVAMDLDKKGVQIESALGKLDSREHLVVDRESKLLAKRREMDLRETRLVATEARWAKNEMLLDQRTEQVAKREFESEAAEEKSDAQKKLLDRHAKEIKLREDFAEAQAADLEEREAAIRLREEQGKLRSVTIAENERHVEKREANVALEWSQIRMERKQAASAGRIQSAFRAYISSAYMTRMREVNDRAIRVASRAKEVEVQTKALAARWMLLETKEGAIQTQQHATAVSVNKSAELSRLLQQQADELKEKRRHVENDEKALARDRRLFDESNNGVEAAAVAIKAQQGDIELKEKRAERLQKQVRAEQHRLVGLQDAARALVAQAAEMDERSKLLDRHEADIVDKRSQVDVLRRSEIADLTSQLAVAIGNAEMFKFELARANAEITALQKSKTLPRSTSGGGGGGGGENVGNYNDGVVLALSNTPSRSKDGSQQRSGAITANAAAMKPLHDAGQHADGGREGDQRRAGDWHEDTFSSAPSQAYPPVPPPSQTSTLFARSAPHTLAQPLAAASETSGKKKKKKKAKQNGGNMPPRRGKTVQISL